MKITIEIESVKELKELKTLLASIDFDNVNEKEISIDEIGLSMFTLNILSEEGIKTTADLICKTEIELLRIPRIGKKCLTEIKDYLCLRGLSLKAE